MTEMDRMLENIKRELELENENAAKARNTQAEADDLKKIAKANEASSKKRIAELEAARAKAEAAKLAYDEVANNYKEYRPIVETSEEEEVVVTRTVEHDDYDTGNTRLVAGFTALAVCFTLIGGGIGYALSRRSLTGKVLPVESDKQIEQPFEYDYSGPVVTVKESTTYVEPTPEPTPVPTEAPYVALTQADFEALVSKSIVELEGMGLAVSREDVVKFITVFNIDKLKQDNPELVRAIIGTQTIEEVFADAEKVSDTMIAYDFQTCFKDDDESWNNYVASLGTETYCPNTENFISISNFAYDAEQQALIADIEEKTNAIANETDMQKRSEMAKSLLLDFTRADSSYQKLDDSTLYFVLRHYVLRVYNLYCWDFFGNKTTLDESANNLMVQFIAPMGSSEDQIINSIMSGARRNMMDSFKTCDQSKVRTLG